MQQQKSKMARKKKKDFEISSYQQDSILQPIDDTTNIE